MVKTTIYLPDELKLAIEAEARSRAVAEAEIIREALTDAASRFDRPKPSGALFADDWGPIDWNTDDWLDGFGEP